MIFLSPCLSVPWPPLLCSYCSPPFFPFYFIDIHNLSSGPCISLSGHLSLFSDHHMLVSSLKTHSLQTPQDLLFSSYLFTLLSPLMSSLPSLPSLNSMMDHFISTSVCILSLFPFSWFIIFIWHNHNSEYINTFTCSEKLRVNGAKTQPHWLVPLYNPDHEF